MLQRQLAARLDSLGDAGILIFASLGLVTFLILADTMIELRPFAARPWWTLLDVLIHGLVAILVTFPLLGIYQDTRVTVILFTAIYLAATLIDLDHFVAAGSLDLSGALSLYSRPLTHSLTFAVVVGLAGYLISRESVIGLALFIALASHVLRDAAGGITPILWPLPVQHVPWWVYYFGEILLLCVSYLLLLRSKGGEPGL